MKKILFLALMMTSCQTFLKDQDCIEHIAHDAADEQIEDIAKQVEEAK